MSSGGILVHNSSGVPRSSWLCTRLGHRLLIAYDGLPRAYAGRLNPSQLRHQNSRLQLVAEAHWNPARDRHRIPSARVRSMLKYATKMTACGGVSFSPLVQTSQLCERFDIPQFPFWWYLERSNPIPQECWVRRYFATQMRSASAVGSSEAALEAIYDPPHNRAGRASHQHNQRIASYATKRAFSSVLNQSQAGMCSKRNLGHAYEGDGLSGCPPCNIWARRRLNRVL